MVSVLSVWDTILAVMISSTQKKRERGYATSLFNAAQTAFGYGFPNFDPTELAKLVCNQSDTRAEHWTLVKLYFYTGIP